MLFSMDCLVTLFNNNKKKIPNIKTNKIIKLGNLKKKQTKKKQKKTKKRINNHIYLFTFVLRGNDECSKSMFRYD